jgi:hypothetical protein
LIVSVTQAVVDQVQPQTTTYQLQPIMNASVISQAHMERHVILDDELVKGKDIEPIVTATLVDVLPGNIRGQSGQHTASTVTLTRSPDL